jgi:hypothetical protein
MAKIIRIGAVVTGGASSVNEASVSVDTYEDGAAGSGSAAQPKPHAGGGGT